MEKAKWDTVFVTGVMIVLVYGIWSTRWQVKLMNECGTIQSKQNAADIREIKIGQDRIIEALENRLELCLKGEKDVSNKH